MAIIPTVRIVRPVTDENPLGFVVINEKDFADGMEIFEDAPSPKTKSKS